MTVPDVACQSQKQLPGFCSEQLEGWDGHEDGGGKQGESKSRERENKRQRHLYSLEVGSMGSGKGRYGCDTRVKCLRGLVSRAWSHEVHWIGIGSPV